MLGLHFNFNFDGNGDCHASDHGMHVYIIELSYQFLYFKPQSKEATMRMRPCTPFLYWQLWILILMFTYLCNVNLKKYRKGTKNKRK